MSILIILNHSRIQKNIYCQDLFFQVKIGGKQANISLKGLPQNDF